MRLGSNKGSGELPGMPLGKYRLRLADLSGQRVLAQQVVGIGVFGQVSFSTLFNGHGGAGVFTTPTNSFPYVAVYGAAERSAFTVEHNHCQSAHVAFVPGGGTSPGTGTVTLVQESRDPVSASTAFNTINSLDAELVLGQSWAVNTSAVVAINGALPPTFYLNGYAVCDSTESFFR